MRRIGLDLHAFSIMPQNKIVTEALRSHPGKIYGQIHADVTFLDQLRRRWDLMDVELGDADALSIILRNYQQALRR
jgi:uncharacterized protein YllA (UPF0747 family)